MRRGLNVAGANATHTINVNAGDKPHEISWNLECVEGQIVEGGAPFRGPLNAKRTQICELTLFDTEGDGWNGAIWELLEPSGRVYFSLSMYPEDGKTKTDTFSVTVRNRELSPPPSPPAPPPAPALPPGGLRVGESTADLRAALGRAQPGEPLEIVLLSNARYALGGIDLSVNGERNITIWGEGATIDGQDA